MKLILCTNCDDVYKLTTKGLRSCECGKTSGQYLSDGTCAVVSDNIHTVVLGLNNGSLVSAMNRQTRFGDQPDGLGRKFDAFVIPEGAMTVQRKKTL